MAATELSERLAVPVRVNRVDIEWFNRLVLEGIYLEDQSGQPLLEVTHLSAGFKVLPLLKGKFVFTTARLFGFSLYLTKENPTAPLNLQFVIDAFASKDSTKQSLNIDLRFNTLLLRKGHLSYDITSEDSILTKFNPKHIDINNLSANISLRAFNKDSLNAHIKKLSFSERSGFVLDKLSMNIVGNRDSAHIDNFEVKLPQSHLKIDQARVKITEINSLSSFLNNAPFELSVAPSTIYLKEFEPFIPAFNHFNDTVQLSAEASGTINNIALKRLTVRQTNKLFFNGMMELKGITNPQETYLFGRVSQMYLTSEGLGDLINNFSGQTTSLPEPVRKLGTLHFTGEISGFFDNLVAFGKFNSPVGSIQTDMIIGSNEEKNIASYMKGHISSSNLSIDKLFGDNNPYGNARFDVTLDARKPVGGTLAGNIKGTIQEFEYKKYTYKNIQLAGNVKANGFDGFIHIDDPNGKIRAEGLFEHRGQNSIFNFTAHVDQLRPDQLYLIDKLDSPEISFMLNADFTGDNIDNAEGTLRLDSLSILTATDTFLLRQMAVTASGHAEERKLSIASDILNGEVVGAYSFTTLVPSLLNTLNGYVPALAKTAQKKQTADNNNFSILLTIENTESLSNTLKLPITVVSPSRITGHYNNQYNKFRLEAWLPNFRTGNSLFEGGYLSCQNPDDKISLRIKAVNYNATNLRNYIDVEMDAHDNGINTLLNWKNNKEHLFKANLTASTLFFNEVDEKGKPSLRTEVSVEKSELVVNDTIWQINPAAISIQHGKIAVDNFYISHDAQYVRINGLVSHHPLDTLYLDLNEIELSYIFETINIPVLQFGGKATGSINMTDLYGSRMLNTDLVVDNFAFNHVQLGRLNLYSEWDDAQRGILMLGSIYKNDSIWTDVNGYIFPVKPNEGLSLYFDANDIDIAFLQPFLKDVASNVRGRGFGQVHLFGPFKELSLQGKAFVENAGMGVDFLNTYYTFSDSVYFTPTTMKLSNVTIYDKWKNTGKASFQFNHKHFKDYNFTAHIQANNMLMYDQSQRNSPMIYGSVFGSGTAVIKGDKNLIDFDINMRNDPHSNVGFNFMTSTASNEYNFITFVDQLRNDSGTVAADSLYLPKTIEEKAEIRMNFLVDVTPNATIELLMDPAGSDRIKGNATGSLQVQYGNKSGLRMYGGVDIVEGVYNFSLQQLFHRDFKIREGSAIRFQGDPYNANMKVNAIYNITANLSDLDQGLLYESARASIPVNCVLQLDGMLRNPSITFDLELPDSNEELQRQVRSFIDTEDMMTRQVIYLLVLNKFYTPDYPSNTQYHSNDFGAVAASALSSQLSGILNSITDKVQIGTNIRTGQEGLYEDTEVEMLLSSQLLDNRLLLNGNFGYRNMSQQRNVFVGEFDLEYKLTPTGEVRLKAYNHANDMYQSLKQSTTTQGVGIMLKKDFTNILDLFRRKRRLEQIRRNEPFDDKAD